MLGSSRGALAASREGLLERAESDGFASASGELLAVAALLGREASLRSALADSGTSETARSEIVQRLLGSRISPLALELVQLVVTQRWAEPRDLVDGLEQIGAEAAFIQAEHEGRLDSVEDELFAFGRAHVADAGLQMALSDPALPDERKAAIVSDLLASRAQPETTSLLQHVVTSQRGRRLDSTIEDLVALASLRHDGLLAEVTVARPLDLEQGQRLSRALGRIYGRPVKLAVEIDPDVIGGVSVKIGDEVIDGTIAHRLEQARRAVT